MTIKTLKINQKIPTENHKIINNNKPQTIKALLFMKINNKAIILNQINNNKPPVLQI